MNGRGGGIRVVVRLSVLIRRMPLSGGPLGTIGDQVVGRFAVIAYLVNRPQLALGRQVIAVLAAVEAAEIYSLYQSF